MARVFLSYSSELHDIADQINLSLVGRGHDVFFDRDDLPEGATFEKQIEAGVKSSDFMIFLVSPHSVQDGRYTLTELKYARKKWPTPDGRVLPVMIQPTPMGDVPSYLKAVTIMEPSGSAPAEVASAIDDMNRAIRRKGRGLRRAMATSVLAIAVAAGVYFNLDRIKPYLPFEIDGETAIATAISADICSGQQLYDAIANGRLSYSEAKSLGETCASELLPESSDASPGEDRREIFASDFATAATSNVESERRAAATVTQGNTSNAVESFFALARAASSPDIKARHYRSAAALAFVTEPAKSIEALEEVVSIEPDDLNSWSQLSSLYRITGDPVNAERVAGEMTNRAGGGGLDWQASARLEQARRQATIGDRNGANESMFASRNLFEQTGNRWGVAQTILFEAELALSRGDSIAGRDLSNDALVLGNNYKFADVVTGAKVSKARALMGLGEFDEAAILFEEAEQEYRDQKNPYGEAYTTSQRGFVALNQFDFSGAKDIFTKARDGMDTLGSREGVAWAEYNIGLAEQSLMQMQSAEDSFSKAQQIFVEIGVPAGEVAAILAIANIKGMQGRSDQSLELLENARRKANASQLVIEEAQSYMGSAYIHRTRGDLDLSEADYLDGLAIYDRANNGIGSMFALEQLGHVALANNNENDARQYWTRAVSISRQIGNDDATTRVEYELSRLGR